MLGNLMVSNTYVERRVTMVFAAKIVLGVGLVVMALAPTLPVAMAGAALAAILGGIARFGR